MDRLVFLERTDKKSLRKSIKNRRERMTIAEALAIVKETDWFVCETVEGVEAKLNGDLLGEEPGTTWKTEGFEIYWAY